jgi:hypothetical protein
VYRIMPCAQGRSVSMSKNRLRSSNLAVPAVKNPTATAPPLPAREISKFERIQSRYRTVITSRPEAFPQNKLEHQRDGGQRRIKKEEVRPGHARERIARRHVFLPMPMRRQTTLGRGIKTQSCASIVRNLEAVLNRMWVDGQNSAGGGPKNCS